MGVWEHLSGNFEWKVPEIFNEEVIVEKLNVVIADVLSTITTMPTLSSMTGIMPIYDFVKIIAYSCTAAIVCYKGIKIMFSPEEFNGAKEGKELFTRITYSLAYSTLSMRFVDTMIGFCNTLISVMTKNFSISNLIPGVKGSGLILAIALLCVELFVSLKILIGFWMRMSELVFLGVISPVVFVLYINKEWGNFLKSWWKRIAAITFTQVAQVALLIIYSAMVNGLVLSGTFNGICLSIATLFLVDGAPKLISNLIDSDTGVKTAVRTVKRLTTRGKKLGGYIRSMKKE